MDTSVLIVFALFFCVRLSTLFISVRNEKRLKREGAREFGKTNSSVLTILHVAFYAGAFAEGLLNRAQFDHVTVVGIAVYTLSMAVLFYVIRLLSPVWTVKLIIAKEHPLNKGFLFRYVRHPNYFLNIVPELTGLCLTMKSWTVLATVFPVYLVSLAVRIFQEEKAMRAEFPDF